MDSSLVNSLFRQLFSHRAGQCLRTVPLQVGRSQRRGVFESRRGHVKVKEEEVEKWVPRPEKFPDHRLGELEKYNWVTAQTLRTRKQRPKRVRMLMRDFIEDSLYNPSYGYFSKQVVIFQPGEPFDFNAIKDEPEFQRILGEKYTQFEDQLDEQGKDDVRQLWHTPTELFRPYYGESIARYLVTNYKLSQYPYHDLLIYEMGAGNGTLMINILDYIRDHHPEVYERTQYRVIEISESLAELQVHQLKRTAAARGHWDKVQIINRSVFDWDQYVSSPCYFLALEVFDNFAHDCIRYDVETEKPCQGSVVIDGQGDFYDFYDENLDPVAARYLRVRDAAATRPFKTPLSGSRLFRNLISQSTSSLTEPEYVPTRLMQFFDILNNYFPAHKLVTSDFHSLPDTIKGINAPVVQTRYRRKTIPVTTTMVQQGYFDILFPTDFQIMEDVYRAITGRLTRVLTHEDFMRRWAYVEDTEVRSGENPLLNWYQNASVMTTV
ncbi:S-adenosyl-L-methionine-dependent methyltransferase [Phyllosticta citricarpa]|uniref:Protein arginine methyltransferase NDUFAF7 n=1 Tax=Phyllosticta citricarpa TaxID=55181 RepID=A0ABR1MN89_9PEZI